MWVADLCLSPGTDHCSQCAIPRVNPGQQFLKVPHIVRQSQGLIRDPQEGIPEQNLGH